MFRTFSSNPGLGGFGNESTIRSGTDKNDRIVTPDAFCQIVKELVDNAVDACTTEVPTKKNKSNNKGKASLSTTLESPAAPKRIRVVIESFTEQKENNNENDGNQELLKVTVSDNGCGMTDIQECVGAFHTSKAHCASDTNSGGVAADLMSNQTAGRYGIGLTLCLLHAQRLVPGSCASIQSATSIDKEWKVFSIVVDTANDKVRCFPGKCLRKSTPTESGTAISVLVPGGSTATLAWSRLAEYFARFELSLDMTCSLEVLAPTLSRVPLWIGIPIRSLKNKETLKCGKKGAINGNNERALHEEAVEIRTTSKENDTNVEREQMWKATQAFLGCSIELANVAHASVPIRIETKTANKKTIKNDAQTGPRLVVGVIVHDRSSSDVTCGMDEERYEMQDGKYSAFSTNEPLDVEASTSKSASMVLIRMVNKIPLLDSAESAACGVIHGLASKTRIWNSFGLEVTTNFNPGNVNTIPTFDVRDSDQVMPFFHKGAHNLLECDIDSDSEGGSESDNDNGHVSIGAKRKRHRSSRQLLPASLRLGNILLIVQIHAEPATLPLPTLCKGRLPIGNKAIDDALEIGITKCLRQLQKTNPNLLLTTAELRKAECDARYVPAVSWALASILSNSKDHAMKTCAEHVQRWDESDSTELTNSHSDGSNASSELKVDHLTMLIERRLRLAMSESTKGTGSSKEGNAKVNEKGDVRAQHTTLSSLDVDSESEFRNGDFITNLKSDESEPKKNVKRTLDDDDDGGGDSDFDEW